jgi:hypothetical protein
MNVGTVVVVPDFLGSGLLACFVIIKRVRTPPCQLLANPLLSPWEKWRFLASASTLAEEIIENLEAGLASFREVSSTS